MDKSYLAKSSATTQNPNWDSWLYRIGCPVWGCKDWTGLVYPKGTPSSQYLHWYSQSFPTVEGNSTFYGVPGKDTFTKWREQANDGFRFCFKFPRAISHDKQLDRCDNELKQWLDCLGVLAESNQLGPTFLQLGPSFSFRYFDRLKSFLSALPSDWPWAVEVRHLDWFDAADRESQLDDFLMTKKIDRVLFDSRPLNSREASDSFEVASQTRKPKSPFRTTVTGTRPMVRLIGRNDPDEITSFWEEWANKIADWIQQGLQPWVFTHAPDDRYAPALAYKLHRLIQSKLPQVPSLPVPTALAEKVSEPNTFRQLDLF
jgi:uncharacterized protein YecE (DUF72 family)